MPRLVFGHVEAFKKWAADKVTKERYDLYLTDSDEIILVPIRSTRPIMYAYFQSGNSHELAEELTAKTGVSVYYVETFDWKTELPPRMKIPVIE